MFLSKVLEVHEKSDLVPAPVHKEKNDCVPKSDHEIWQKSDLSSRSHSRSWHIIICFKSRVEVTKFDISQNISGILTTFGCTYCFINRGNTRVLILFWVDPLLKIVQERGKTEILYVHISTQEVKGSK